MEKIRRDLNPVYPKQKIKNATRKEILCCETSIGFGSSAIRLAAGLPSDIDQVEVMKTLLGYFDIKGKQNVLGKKRVFFENNILNS